MKSLSRLLSPERIVWLDQEKKNDCLQALVDAIAATTAIDRPSDVFHAILERERLLSTGFGLGLAIPHAKLKEIKDFVVAVGIHRKGVSFDSLDDMPVHVLVMILGPESQQEEYLKVLSRVTAFLKDNRERLLSQQGSDAVYKLTLEY
jgi:mannitol/fructose-specific phosphotransferase system IIA component (Ntr-type)